MNDEGKGGEGCSLQTDAQLRELAATYKARLDALEISKASIDGLMRWITWGGGAFAMALALLAWWFGHSYSEATDNAQKAASSAFEREFFRNRENANDFNALRESYEQSVGALKKVELELKGYIELRDLMSKAENFDPLEQFLALSKEIGQRKENGAIAEPAFRQRAAYVFQRLLEQSRKDRQTDKARLDVVTLFNAAANASKVDMDFVALELIEAAVAQDKSRNPVYEARLIRLRLRMSNISSEEAIAAMDSVLARTHSPTLLHHVISEVFNLGIIANQPVRTARAIAEHLPTEFQQASYVLLNRAQLMGKGALQSDWAESEQLKAKGATALMREPASVPWFESSLDDAVKMGIDVKEMLARKRVELPASKSAI